MSRSERYWRHNGKWYFVASNVAIKFDSERSYRSVFIQSIYGIGPSDDDYKILKELFFFFFFNHCFPLFIVTVITKIYSRYKNEGLLCKMFYKNA